MDATVTVNGSPVLRARGVVQASPEPEGHLKLDLVVPQLQPADRPDTTPWRSLRREMTPAEVERLLEVALGIDRAHV